MNKSIMWKHIYEQQKTLKDLLSSRSIQEFVEHTPVVKFKKMVFVAFGSSYNCTIAAKKYFEQLANIEVLSYSPFDFLELEPLQRMEKETTLVVGISQTGTSSGTIRALQLAKDMGFEVLTITERQGTPVEKLGNYYLNMLCGEEPCNAKTKGFSHSVLLLILLALWIAKEKANIGQEDYNMYVNELKESVNDLPSTIERTKSWLRQHQDWAQMKHFYVVGYGDNYGVAMEGTIKLIETLCIPGTICELGELSHGVHRTLNENSNIITVQTEGYAKELMSLTNQFFSKKVARFLCIQATEDPEENDENSIIVPYRPLTASLLNIVVVFQVLATALPELNGKDPDSPSNDEYTELVGTR